PSLGRGELVLDLVQASLCLGDVSLQADEEARRLSCHRTSPQGDSRFLTGRGIGAQCPNKANTKFVFVASVCYTSDKLRLRPSTTDSSRTTRINLVVDLDVARRAVQAWTEACNFVSVVSFENGNLANAVRLHGLTYQAVRARFGISAH